MIPAVRIPAGAKLRNPVEIKLKPGWHFDARRRAFVSDRGESFAPRGELPKDSQIVPKMPALAAAKRTGKATLSAAEQNLLRHLHVILPPDHSAAAHLAAVRQWPCVEEAALPPEVSLPGGTVGPGL